MDPHRQLVERPMISADPTKKTLPAHRHAPAQGSFRLLDLPRELRDEIYGSALTYKLKEAAFHDVPPPFERPNLNLLRCSKQLNQEATKAFVISNLLIKVEMNIVHLTRGCCPKPITWINGLDDKAQTSAKAYRKCVMSMKVFGHPRSSRPPFYGVIPKSQLEALCRVLNLGSQAAQYPWPWKEMELGILVDSPFGPDFREMINDTLMPIVHRHLQDKTFTAHHRQKPGEFVQDLTHKDAPFRELTSVDGLIDRMNARKELGSKSFKRQDFVGAATVWTYAIYYVAYYCDETKINRRIAADLKTYNLRLGELGFLLGSNAAAAWNALGKRPFGERPFGKPREYYSSMSRWSLERSMKLRKTYVASKDQKLKYEYRLAIACKHLEDWGALWARLTMLWAWAGGRTGSLWPNMVRSIVGWQKWRRSRFLRTVVSISGINDGAVGVGDQAVSTPLTLYWNDSDKLECHQHER